MNRGFAVVIEQAEDNYAAYVPDLPGCVATGATPSEVEERIRSAIALHLAGLRADGLTIPEPTSRVAVVEPAPA
jgi:predicted RNase H-like HicB family nuclease